MDLDQIKKVHLIGIGGIGISALARYFLHLGKVVTGSDMVDSDNIHDLIKNGVKVSIKHNEKNLEKDVDLVIYSVAVPEDNPERKKAKKLDIKELKYAQALGEISKDKKAIVISGCHGKTTTTAMMGLMLDKAKKDPTVVVGSIIKEFEGNFRLGKSEYFVVEGDEFNANFMYLKPKVAIITNIDKDHLDYYKTFNKVVETFEDFIYKIPRDGILIYNLDDPTLKHKIEMPPCQVLSYSIEDESADLYAFNIRNAHGRQIFRVIYKGQEIKRDFNLQIPGKFNISNALGPMLYALELNIKPDLIKDVLALYQGAWRRFEKVGEIKNLKNNDGEDSQALVISDYAHHPVELEKTVKAAHEFYEDQRLVLVFQPHQKSRTKLLFNDFVKVLTDTPADIIVLPEIYNVSGRDKKEEKISSKDIVEAVKKDSKDKVILFAEDLEETEKIIHENIKGDDVLLIAGAGDIDSLARKIVK